MKKLEIFSLFAPVILLFTGGYLIIVVVIVGYIQDKFCEFLLKKSFKFLN